jgi:predicted polyphosphate/ATP-dependent NAD kinase
MPAEGKASLLRIGFILNPIAGMGGSVALKGTDGPMALMRARSLGAVPMAPTRALRCLNRLAARAATEVEIHAPAGIMGTTVARQAGFAPKSIEGPSQTATSAEDTRAAARALVQRDVALILFAGGDGTARDIVDAVGNHFPILGIPAGVKMQSAVFAVSPEAAGELIALLARGAAGRIGLRDAEVMDLDEAGMREGSLSARLYGFARVPFERRLVQSPKAAQPDEDSLLDALCREVALEMEPGVLYVLGPGTTTARVLRHRGLEGTLLGVDAVWDRQVIGRDLSSRTLEGLLAGRQTRLILGIIGGQGFVFGRGNQQIAPSVIRAVGRDNITLLASQRKLLALNENCLFSDTGDPEVDAMLAGYIRVRIAPGQSTLMRICHCQEA